ncbi:MAG: hypothetical protein EHM84_02275 [Lysobacterales bacterium]|nr:MAG: hypothetical protein EHM84_02275 [Xanthomonadales bacterium]
MLAKKPKMRLVRRLLVVCGWALAIIALFVGISVVFYGVRMPMPNVPNADAPRLDRIEAFVERAATQEERNSYLIVGCLLTALGVFVTVATTTAELTRADTNRLQHEALRLENAELKQEIEDLEKEVDEAGESEAETTKLFAGIFGPRAFRPGGRPPPRFGKGPTHDEEDDEDESPLFPPKIKPPYLN